MATETQRATGVTRAGVLRALAFVLGVNAVGAAPSLFFGADTDWFEKPSLFPPEIAFPIVWTLLFSLLGIALFLVWRRGIDDPGVRVAFGAFTVQFALNLVWTPAFFGLERPDLGLVVIGLLWLAIVGTIWAFDRVDRRAAALLIPYLLWVSFAAVLNYQVYANWA